MTIVELADYSMVIMKDSDDPYWESVSRYVGNLNRRYVVVTKVRDTNIAVTANDYISTGGKLILYFPDKISPLFNKGDKIELY